MKGQEYLLTDFNDWDYDLEMLNLIIKDLNKWAKDKILLGYLNDGIQDVKESAFRITSLRLEDKKVYGKLHFVNTDAGEKAYEIVQTNYYKFGVCFIHVNGVIMQILTWNIIPDFYG